MTVMGLFQVPFGLFWKHFSVACVVRTVTWKAQTRTRERFRGTRLWLVATFTPSGSFFWSVFPFTLMSLAGVQPGCLFPSPLRIRLSGLMQHLSSC